MDLVKELISVLNKAKESGEYANPFLVSAVLERIEDLYPDTVSDSLWNWSQNLYSR